MTLKKLQQESGGWEERFDEKFKPKERYREIDIPLPTLDDFRDFIRTELQNQRQSIVKQVEGMKKKEWKIQKRAAYKTGSDVGMGHALGYREALDDIINFLQEKG